MPVQSNSNRGYAECRAVINDGKLILSYKMGATGFIADLKKSIEACLSGYRVGGKAVTVTLADDVYDTQNGHQIVLSAAPEKSPLGEICRSFLGGEISQIAAYLLTQNLITNEAKISIGRAVSATQIRLG